MGEKLKKLVGVQGDFRTTILPMIYYSYANMYLGGAGYIISMYFTVFLTDVVNISLRQAGLVVMIATVWDAVTDPVMGIITDRTRSKTSKHRRYLLWGIPLMFLSYTLLWNSFGLNGKKTRQRQVSTSHSYTCSTKRHIQSSVFPTRQCFPSLHPSIT